jgi:phosphate transport system substrate-binding protein
MTIFGKTTITSLMLSAAFFAPTNSIAQTTLQAHGGGFVLEGELLSYEDGTYTIRTSQGDLLVGDAFVNCTGVGCPGTETETEVQSRDVLITAFGGSFEIEGQMVDVTDTSFVVNTVTGELTIRRELVSCSGAGCPTTDVQIEDFAIAVPAELGIELLTAVVSDFVASKEFSMTQSIGGGDVAATLFVGNDQGAQIANIDVNTLEFTDAIRAVLDGDVAFAMTNEQIAPEALSLITGSRVQDINDLLVETTIGLDAVSFVVNEGNRIRVMDTSTVRDVLAGNLTNWSELGGADQPINVHMLSSDAGMARQLDLRLMSGTSVSEAHTFHENVESLNSSVEADQNALGVVYRSQVENARPVNLVNSCNVFYDNDDFAIQTEEYPLAIRWFQYSARTAEQPSLAEDIGSYIVTDFGQQSIASRGFVTQELRVIPMKDQGARLLTSILASDGDRTSSNVIREYLTEASQAERLSTSLRFLSGATALDAKAIDDIRRISDVVRSREYEGYEVLVFGFTDSYGKISSNLALAKRRAEAVKSTLLSENIGFLDTANVTTFGMGPIAPVDCNDTASGRQLNRRVEIWIRPQV